MKYIAKFEKTMRKINILVDIVIGLLILYGLYLMLFSIMSGFRVLGLSILIHAINEFMYGISRTLIQIARNTEHA